MTKVFKKCSTDQRFIRKRNTTNKIGTLEEELKNFEIEDGQNKVFK